MINENAYNSLHVCLSCHAATVSLLHASCTLSGKREIHTCTTRWMHHVCHDILSIVVVRNWHTLYLCYVKRSKICCELDLSVVG